MGTQHALRELVSEIPFRVPLVSKLIIKTTNEFTPFGHFGLRKQQEESQM